MFDEIYSKEFKKGGVKRRHEIFHLSKFLFLHLKKKIDKERVWRE
jgi:hypothetical protein